jgi:hypothetical protein
VTEDKREERKFKGIKKEQIIAHTKRELRKEERRKRR